MVARRFKLHHYPIFTVVDPLTPSVDGLMKTPVARHPLRRCEEIIKQTFHHRDTEALRIEKKGPFLCASVSLW